MDQKSIISGIVGAIIAGVVALVISWVAGVWSKGTEALATDQIRIVLEQEGLTKAEISAAVADSMKTDIDGQTLTYGQALSKMHTQLAVLQTKQQTLIEAVGALADSD